MFTFVPSVRSLTRPPLGLRASRPFGPAPRPTCCACVRMPGGNPQKRVGLRRYKSSTLTHSRRVAEISTGLRRQDDLHCFGLTLAKTSRAHDRANAKCHQRKRFHAPAKQGTSKRSSMNHKSQWHGNTIAKPSKTLRLCAAKRRASQKLRFAPATKTACCKSYKSHILKQCKAELQPYALDVKDLH